MFEGLAVRHCRLLTSGCLTQVPAVTPRVARDAVVQVCSGPYFFAIHCFYVLFFSYPSTHIFHALCSLYQIHYKPVSNPSLLRDCCHRCYTPNNGCCSACLQLCGCLHYSAEVNTYQEGRRY